MVAARIWVSGSLFCHLRVFFEKQACAKPPVATLQIGFLTTWQSPCARYFSVTYAGLSVLSICGSCGTMHPCLDFFPALPQNSTRASSSLVQIREWWECLIATEGIADNNDLQLNPRVSRTPLASEYPTCYQFSATSPKEALLTSPPQVSERHLAAVEAS